MATDFVSPAVYAAAGQYALGFQQAQPFKYVVIDNFLKPECARQLVDAFPAHPNPSQLVNEFGDPNPKSAISDVAGLGGVYAELDRYIQTTGFLRLMEQITGVPDLKYDPHYYGAGTHENFHTAGLDPHYDFNIHPITRQHRRLNAIIYLNDEWKAEWGGSIAFHSNAWDLENDQITEVVPLLNRCVVFETTEKSWHSVPPVNLPPELRHKSRKSFTIYLYTDDRPAAEMAPEHGTVYVQEALPKTMRPGQVLSEEDYQKVRSNIQRRHSYLRALYKREYQFSTHIAALATECRTLRRHLHVPLIGYAKPVQADSSLDVDGWLGAHLSLTLRLYKPALGVRLHGWRPDDEQRPIDVELVAQNQLVKRQCLNGGFTMEVLFAAADSRDLELRIRTQTLQVQGGTDMRELSFIVDRLEILHPA